MFLMSFWKKSVAPASFSPDEKYNSSEGHVIKRVFSLSVLKSMVDLIYKNKIIFEHKFKNKHSEQKKIFVTVLHRHISTKMQIIPKLPNGIIYYILFHICSGVIFLNILDILRFSQIFVPFGSFGAIFGSLLILLKEAMDDKVKEKLKCVLDILVKPFANIKDDTCLNKLIDFLQTNCMTIYLFLYICHVIQVVLIHLQTVHASCQSCLMSHG